MRTPRTKPSHSVRGSDAASTSPPVTKDSEESEPGASEQDHDHGGAPHFLPHWMQERWAVVTVAIAGVALTVGFFGEKFFGLPHSVALGFYLLAYAAGGYDVARAALPALFRGKFDIDL